MAADTRESKTQTGTEMLRERGCFFCYFLKTYPQLLNNPVNLTFNTCVTTHFSTLKAYGECFGFFQDRGMLLSIALYLFVYQNINRQSHGLHLFTTKTEINDLLTIMSCDFKIIICCILFMYLTEIVTIIESMKKGSQ